MLICLNINGKNKRNKDISGGAKWFVAKQVLHAELEDAVWRKNDSSGFALIVENKKEQRNGNKK